MSAHLQTMSVSARLLALIMMCALCTGATALEFDMIYQTKCILEEIDENIIVLGEYEAIRTTDRTYMPVDVKVTTAAWVSSANLDRRC
jgi:hypothetical protein